MNKMVKVSLAGMAAAAMIAPASIAFAEKTGPEFYGQVNFELTNTDEGGDTNAEWGTNSNYSRLGVKGTNTLDNGLQAFYQIESSVDYNVGVLSGRDTFVGLRGDFGQVSFGRQAAAYRQMVYTGAFSSGTNDTLGVVRAIDKDTGNDLAPGFSTSGVVAPVSRENGVIRYNNSFDGINFAFSLTPVNVPDSDGVAEGDMNFAFGGSMKPMDELTIALAYENRAGGSGTHVLGTTDNDDQTSIGFKAVYNMAPFTVGLGYEQVSNIGNAKDTDLTKIVIPFKMDLGDGMSFNIAISQSEFDLPSGAPSVDSHMNYTVGFEKALGGNTLLQASYAVSDGTGELSAGSTSRDDISVLAFGVKHSF
ncbi:porin [Desulfurispira natronophila]|nr:porin [Desulfurispira natronophila]